MNKLTHQLTKIRFYAGNAVQLALPRFLFQRRLADKLARVADDPEIQRRVAYYAQCADAPFPIPAAAIRIADIPRGKSSAYYFDLDRIVRYFPKSLRLAYLFGDITEVPPEPTIVKSRPIGDHNRNSVLLKLNQIRHFRFITKDRPFAEKNAMAVWRGKCYGKAHRLACVERHCQSPRIDVGDVNPRLIGTPHYKPYLSIAQQLEYKFILSIEGRDVATNLKWILSSNSLCFMTRPKFETWFMEGGLIPDHHYVLVKEDYSDVEEKMDYYLSNPAAAAAIIANAQRHVETFNDARREEATCLLVLKNYFHASGQLT